MSWTNCGGIRFDKLAVKLLFLLAGVPKRLKMVIDRNDRGKVGRDDDLQVFAGGEAQLYPPEVRTTLLRSAVEWVQRRAVDEAFGVALLRVKSDDGSGDAVEADFFPFAFQSVLDVGPMPKGENQLRAAKNAFLRDVTRACAVIRQRAKVMREHLISNAKATPLLLPIANFNEAQLRERLFNLYRAGGSGDSMAQSIAWTKSRLDRELPKVKHSGKFYFAANNLLFVPPGDQGHALVSVSEACPPRCFLAGRTRLGASFNPRLHYDCKPVHGSLRATYGSCHGQEFKPPRTTHLNIAPNDNLR